MKSIGSRALKGYLRKYQVPKYEYHGYLLCRGLSILDCCKSIVKTTLLQRRKNMSFGHPQTSLGRWISYTRNLKAT